MNAVPDAWKHDALGWVNPAIDDVPPWDEPAAPAVEPRATNALGVDVSAYQGTAINWQQVAASGRQFVMIKSSEGTTYVSPALDAQYQGATAAGLLCGLYHYGTPSATSTPEAEADAFAMQINRLGAVAGHMPPCLDLETGTGDLSGWAQRFITRLRAKTGCVRVLVYSGAAFMQNQVYGNGSWLDANVALWVAAWSDPPGRPSFCPPATALHQYSSSGQVSGIAGNVDLDYALWPLTTLVPGATPAPVTTTPPAPVAPSPVTSLTVDQVNQILGFLTALYQQSSGSVNLGSWTGWPSWPGGSGRSLTPVDYLRQADELQNTMLSDLAALAASVSTLSSQVAALKSQVPAASASISAADQQAIALAVVTMLTQRLAS